MARGRTLWEMLMGHFQGPLEFRYYNPLRAKVGSAILLDEIEFRDHQFSVKEIYEYKRTINGNAFLFCDYVLLARPLHQDEIVLRLRVNPVADPAKVAGPSYQVLLLWPFDSLAYNEGLHQAVTDDTQKFQVIENGVVQEEYYRVHDVASAYRARVAILRDEDSNQRVDADEVETMILEYWDYWRETQDDAGLPFTQFLFVEMNTANGWFQIWRGREIDPQRAFVV
jgi:hypothetical protein